MISLMIGQKATHKEENNMVKHEDIVKELLKGINWSPNITQISNKTGKSRDTVAKVHKDLQSRLKVVIEDIPLHELLGGE